MLVYNMGAIKAHQLPVEGLPKLKISNQLGYPLEIKGKLAHNLNDDTYI